MNHVEAAQLTLADLSKIQRLIKKVKTTDDNFRESKIYMPCIDDDSPYIRSERLVPFPTNFDHQKILKDYNKLKELSKISSENICKNLLREYELWLYEIYSQTEFVPYYKEMLEMSADDLDYFLDKIENELSKLLPNLVHILLSTVKEIGNLVYRKKSGTRSIGTIDIIDEASYSDYCKYKLILNCRGYKITTSNDFFEPGSQIMLYAGL